MNHAPLSPEAHALLRFYEEAGVTTAECDKPGGLWSMGAKPAALPQPATLLESVAPPAAPEAVSAPSTDEALASAEQIAASCTTLEDLVKAIAGFEGCPLREDARGPVIYDGVLGAPVLVMGEAPGREEDRQGKPFVGRSGQLLDRMLSSIGLSRSPTDGETPVCISNAIFWRPPGNRNPTKAEIAICLPFARRFIELSNPKLVLMTGNVPTQALFPDAPGITRSRGSFRAHLTNNGTEIPALPIFHPAFLLRQPAQKRWAWKDLQAAQSKLNETLS